MEGTVINSIFYYYLNPAWRKKEDDKYQVSWSSSLAFLLKKVLKPILKPNKVAESNFALWKNKNLFFLGTLNQFYSFDALKVNPRKSIVYTRFKNPPFAEFGYTFSTAPTKELSFKESVAFVTLFLRTWIGASEKNRKVLINRLHAVFEYYKYYCFYCSAFLENKPLRVVLFNDHSPFYRMILESAKHANVQTVYFPHAGVSDKFPALEFDYAYLYSQSMLDTYKKCGSTNTRIEILGCKKYIDMVDSATNGSESEVLGVSFNSHMRVEDVNDYLDVLRTSGKDFIVRPHPEIPVSVFKKQYEVDPDDKFSDPKEESPLDFLKRIAMLIGPVSNMFLEAALCKVRGIQLIDPKSKLNDNYGFIEKGLIVNKASSSEELLAFLTNEVKVELPSEGILEYFSGPLSNDSFEEKLNAIPEFR